MHTTPRMLRNAHLSTDIMTNIAAPPALELPRPSVSLPVSRLPTPPGKRRTSWSMPTSPRLKKPLSPITKSPTRKHRYHATFGKYDHRREREPTLNLNHAYATGEEQLRMLPRSHSSSAIFGTAPRESTRAPLCPIHSYSTIEQELAIKPSTAVGGVKFSDTSRMHLGQTTTPCPVHSYATIEQELAVLPRKAFGGVKFTTSVRMTPARANCPVHVYAEAKSTLSTVGAGAFSTSDADRYGYQGVTRALAPVHAYAAPRSTLLTTGGAVFGHPRAAQPPPMPLPPTRKTLLPKKLKPLHEIDDAAARDGANIEAGSESPREIETVLA